MNMKSFCSRLALLSAIFFACTFSAFGQTTERNLDGWHIGIIGEGNVAQKISVTPHSTSYVPFKAVPMLGWKVGAEFSYHFAKYFGVSCGISYGTVGQWKVIREYNSVPWGHRASYVQLPIHFEFHSQLGQSNFWFYSSAGINLAFNPFYRRAGAVMGIENYNDKVSAQFTAQSNPPVFVDAVLNAGFYYRLPYNDLLRFGFVANFSFSSQYVGSYTVYGLNPDSGTLNYKHNYLGFQVGYIHCFKKKSSTK